jgi:hypothetical protein
MTAPDEDRFKKEQIEFEAFLANPQMRAELREEIDQRRVNNARAAGFGWALLLATTFWVGQREFIALLHEDFGMTRGSTLIAWGVALILMFQQGLWGRTIAHVIAGAIRRYGK